MPVPALSLTQDGVLLEGLPLEQASDARAQLRLSCSIAMAQNAKLRVIRVRNGSLLDEDSMAILREMAEDRDWSQVWIEMVDTTGKVGIVIESREGEGGGEVSRLLFRIVGTLAMPFVIVIGTLHGIRDAIRIWWVAMKAEDVQAALRSQRKGK